MNDKNCGTCRWRYMESRINNLWDKNKLTTSSAPVQIVWLCNNSESDNYMNDVSDPHGSCDAWEG